MSTERLNLPKITGNMTADVVRDFNGLAEAIDEKVALQTDVEDIGQKADENEQVLNEHLANLAKVGLDYGSDNGDVRGENAVDLQHVRIASDQVAGAPNSFIAGGSRNKIKNIVERDSDARNAHAEGYGNRVHDWEGHAEGSHCIVDGKISHAEGNAVICTANDSHAEGNRTVAGRRYYTNVSYGSEDAGSGLGVLNYVLIPPNEGDVTSFFPNPLTDNITTRYGVGAQKDVKGNIYPSGMTPAVWNGDVPSTPNDLRWALHSICIVRGQSESAIDFVKIAKSTYTPGTGTKVYYYGDNPFGTLIGIYSSYSPTVRIEGKTQGGNGSHAEGVVTSAWDYGAHAEGYLTRAWGYASHAEGRETTALGMYSHAEGYQTEAIGNNSCSSGWQSEALRDFQKSYSVGQIAKKGDNQTSEISYTHRLVNAGWHVVQIFRNLEDGKAYNFETMLIGRQVAGTAGAIGDTFAYKFSGCVVRNGDNYTVLGSPTRTLIGRTSTMEGDGLSTGVRVSWDNNYSSTVLLAGDQNNSIYLRMDGIANTTFQVTTYNTIQEMGL